MASFKRNSWVKITLQNIRNLQSCTLDLSPGNVYALVGRNNAGKSAILEGLRWMKHAEAGMCFHLDRGLARIHVELEDWSWELLEQPPSQGRPWENLFHGQRRVGGFGSLRASSSKQAQEIKQWVTNTYVWLDLARKDPREDMRAIYSHGLSEQQREWIVGKVQETFPGAPLELKNHCGISSFALLLAILLHVPEKSILGIELPETGLHPHAIRSLMECFREEARNRNLIIILETQSSVLLNTFTREYEEEVLIVSPERTWNLLELFSVNWLRHFALGDLFERNEFDPPKKAQSNVP